MNKKIIIIAIFAIMITTMLTIFNPSDKINLIENQKKPEEKKSEIIIKNKVIKIIEGEDYDLLSSVYSNDESEIKTNITTTKNLVAGNYKVKYFIKKKNGSNITESADLIVLPKVENKNNTKIELINNNYNYRKPIIYINENIFNLEINTSIPTYTATAIDYNNNLLNVEIYNNININAIGKYYVTFVATDNLGNTSYVEKEINVIDTNKPFITSITNSSENNWTNEDIDIEYSYDDLESGIAYYEYSFDGINYTKTNTTKLIFTEEQENTLFLRAVDNSGNKSEITKTFIKIDKTAPSIENKEIELESTKEYDFSEIITIKENFNDYVKIEYSEIMINSDNQQYITYILTDSSNNISITDVIIEYVDNSYNAIIMDNNSNIIDTQKILNNNELKMNEKTINGITYKLSISRIENIGNTNDINVYCDTDITKVTTINGDVEISINCDIINIINNNETTNITIGAQQFTYTKDVGFSLN